MQVGGAWKNNVILDSLISKLTHSSIQNKVSMGSGTRALVLPYDAC